MRQPTLKHHLIACFLMISIHSNAQSILATSGAYSHSSKGSLEWTLGEVATETYQKSFGVFTQGFHQTFPETKGGTEVSIYPNPVVQFLTIKTPVPGNYSVELFNVHGTKLTHQDFSSNSFTTLHHIDLRELSAAVYFLFLRNMSTGKKSTFKVIKD